MIRSRVQRFKSSIGELRSEPLSLNRERQLSIP